MSDKVKLKLEDLENKANELILAGVTSEAVFNEVNAKLQDVIKAAANTPQAISKVEKRREKEALAKFLEENHVNKDILVGEAFVNTLPFKLTKNQVMKYMRELADEPLNDSKITVTRMELSRAFTVRERK